MRAPWVCLGCTSGIGAGDTAAGNASTGAGSFPAAALLVEDRTGGKAIPSAELAHMPLAGSCATLSLDKACKSGGEVGTSELLGNSGAGGRTVPSRPTLACTGVAASRLLRNAPAF